MADSPYDVQGGGTILRLSATTQGVTAGVTGGFPFDLKTNDLARLRIDRNGNVGIGTGTGNINAKLQVAGTIQTDSLTSLGTIQANTFQGDGSGLTGVLPTVGGTIDGSLEIAENLSLKGQLQLARGLSINEVSGDGTLGSRSDEILPTQQAVLTYVENQIEQVKQDISQKADIAFVDAQINQVNNTLSTKVNFTSEGNVEILKSENKRFGLFVDADLFAYDNKTMGNYSLGWFSDSWQPDGATAWFSGWGGIRFFTASLPRLSINLSGFVGIGTSQPRNPLAIRGQGGSEELISFEAPDGTTKWHINQNLGGDNPGLNFVETAVADGRLFLRAGGRVGINTTNPVTALHVAGNFRANNFDQTSDRQLKTNINPLNNVLEKLEQIQGVTFEWNDLYKTANPSKNRQEIGLIAQEVEAVFPELVTQLEDGHKAVDYLRLTSVLVEAVKALNKENEMLKQQIQQIANSLNLSTHDNLAPDRTSK